MAKGRIRRKLKKFLCISSKSQATGSTEANVFQGTEQSTNPNDDGPLDGGGLKVEAQAVDSDVDDIGVENVPHDRYSDTHLVAESAINQARQAQVSRRNLGSRNKDVMETINPEMGTIKSVGELWKPVLEKVELFADLIDKIGQIHPYAKIATTVFSAGVNVVIAQVERDEAMEELSKVMDEVYAFMIRAEELRDMDENRKKLLIAMSLQTIECAFFIRDHDKVQKFWMRAAVNAIGGSRIDEKIKEFTQAFRDIRRCFAERSILEGEIRMVKILELGLDMQTTLDLLKLHSIRGAGLDSSRGCLPGTREETLNDIVAWINDPKPDTSRVRFLLGGAGTGKSSIAHSIGAYFHTMKRLGSFIRFDRSSLKDLRQVIPTIARNLGNWDPAFRRALGSVIHNNRDLEDSVDMAQQWQGLILEPLKNVALVGPVVIVIDAFDECSSLDSSERRQLLNIIAEGSDQLPENIHMLITSRPESDVARVAHANSHARIDYISLDQRREEAMVDIERYVRHQLAPDGSDDALDDDDIQWIVTKAEGLFQWAATACRAICQNAAAITLKERFDSRLGRILGGGPSSLDDLYRSILQQAFQLEEPIVAKRFRSVMGQLFCASSPLSMESLDQMRRLATGVQKDEVTIVLQHLGPLLSGISDRHSPILPLHTSFRDFLIDRGRSQDWCVDLEVGHTTMAVACFRLMNTLLRFNICRLETSYLPNRDIPDLDTRISTFVSPGLAYATCNWKDHLAAAAPPELSNELDKFLREKLLFWFELVGLLKFANRAASSLEKAQQLYEDILSISSKELLRDAISFARFFAAVMAHTAPHVYLSGLTFSPTASSVRANYLPHFTWLPVVNGLHYYWPQARAVLTGHSNVVTCTAYSPDGRHIASGSADNKVRIWDAETGETVHTLSCGSTVYGVAFSPGGHRIATALQSGTVSIWDSTTWHSVQEFSSGSEVNCVVYSPDGCFVAAGNDHGRIHVWSSETFEIIHQLIHGEQPIISIAYSSCGRYIVSGSEDSTVQISDTVEGKAVGAHLEGHTDSLTSVLFSLDGCRIVSGSDDSTIRIWEVETRNVLSVIPVSAPVWSLSLSPDGRRIACGLRDGSVLIWNSETYEMVAGPFLGHTSFVKAVDFARDGRHVVSGSTDNTVRIWSTEETSGNVSSSQTGSTVTSLAYSPDGSRIITGSSGGSIGVWDIEAGKSICSWKGHSAEIIRIRFSPDGGHFVSASYDASFRVWNSTTFKPHGEPIRGWVLDVAYSPDSSRIVSCSDDQTLRIWDADTCQCLLGPLNGHSNLVLCVAWSPNGKHIVSGSQDKTVLVWDAETGCVMGEPFKGHEDWIRSVSWAKDGHSVMSSDAYNTIVWDLETRTATGQLLLSGRSVYSPDYQWILSGTVNGRMQLWDAQTREPIGAGLSDPFGMPSQFEFSPDGRRIALVRRGDSALCVVCDVKAFTDPSGTHPSFKNLISAPIHKVEDLPKISRDGWATNAEGNLIIWVPDEYRESLVWRGMLFTIPEHKPVTIDFSNACYGSGWAGCYRA